MEIPPIKDLRTITTKEFIYLLLLVLGTMASGILFWHNKDPFYFMKLGTVKLVLLSISSSLPIFFLQLGSIIIAKKIGRITINLSVSVAISCILTIYIIAISIGIKELCDHHYFRVLIVNFMIVILNMLIGLLERRFRVISMFLSNSKVINKSD